MLTNVHVVTYSTEEHFELYDSISFRIYNSNEFYSASIIDFNINKGLCLLKIDTSCEDLLPLTMNNNTEIEQGEKIYAVGNALNHGIGITEGIISIPYINIEANDNNMLVIQCDIVIANGSSGGAKNQNFVDIKKYRK